MYSVPKEFIPFTGDIDSVEHSVDIHNRYLKNNAVLDRAKELQVYSIHKKIRDKVCFEAIKRGVFVPKDEYWYKRFSVALVSPEYLACIDHNSCDKEGFERGMAFDRIEAIQELGTTNSEYVSRVNELKSKNNSDYIIAIDNLMVNIVDVVKKDREPRYDSTVLYYDEVFFRYWFSDSAIIEV